MNIRVTGECSPACDETVSKCILSMLVSVCEPASCLAALELVAAVTGQPHEWIVAPGTVD